MTYDFIEDLRQSIPAVFEGKRVEHYTGGGCRWRTLQNMKSQGLIDSSCFIRDGRKILIRRDSFLDWWSKRLREG